jgi:hypothetical protein
MNHVTYFKGHEGCDILNDIYEMCQGFNTISSTGYQPLEGIGRNNFLISGECSTAYKVFNVINETMAYETMAKLVLARLQHFNPLFQNIRIQVRKTLGRMTLHLPTKLMNSISGRTRTMYPPIPIRIKRGCFWFMLPAPFIYGAANKYR